MSEGALSVTIEVDVSRYMRAIHDVQLLAFRGNGRKLQHGPRCGYCTPMANPRPLCIDGHAYRARTRNRRRRR